MNFQLNTNELNFISIKITTKNVGSERIVWDVLANFKIDFSRHLIFKIIIGKTKIFTLALLPQTHQILLAYP